MNTLIIWIMGILAFYGLADLYMWWRMRRSNKVDKTASLGNWIALKWVLATQSDLVAEKLPFLQRDLSENIGVKDDDGNIS